MSFGIKSSEVQALRAQLDRIETIVSAIERNLNAVASLLSDKIATLQADVTAQTTVTQSVITLLAGVPQLIADAVAKAIEAGATPEQLQSLTDLASGIEANTAGLATAVTAEQK